MYSTPTVPQYVCFRVSTISPSLAVSGRPLSEPTLKGLVQISIVKTVEAKFEFVDFRPGQALERIEFGPAGTHGAIGGDQLANGGLFLDVATGDCSLQGRNPPSLASSVKAAITGACATSRATKPGICARRSK
jgi:hypothetical protein